jgi:hypothetical protein
MSADTIGPWTFDRGRSTPKRRPGGPLFTSDLPDPETVARRKKHAEVDAIPDAVVPPDRDRGKG